MKPGYLTTEFWGKVALEVGVVAAALSSNLSPKWAAVAVAISEGAYAIGRGLAKSKTPGA